MVLPLRQMSSGQRFHVNPNTNSLRRGEKESENAFLFVFAEPFAIFVAQAVAYMAASRQGQAE